MKEKELAAVSPDSAELDKYIKEIASGDKTAFEKLYGAVSGAVFAYSLSVLRNRQDAEDVLHDCFVNIYFAAAGYKSSGKPMSWIMTITHNLCMNVVKTRGRAALLDDNEWESVISELGLPPSDEKILLLSAMKSLSREERKLVILHAVAGFKHREIAGMMDLPLSTVLSKYNRACKKIKDAMETES